MFLTSVMDPVGPKTFYSKKLYIGTGTRYSIVVISGIKCEFAVQISRGGDWFTDNKKNMQDPELKLP